MASSCRSWAPRSVLVLWSCLIGQCPLPDVKYPTTTCWQYNNACNTRIINYKTLIDTTKDTLMTTTRTLHVILVTRTFINCSIGYNYNKATHTGLKSPWRIIGLQPSYGFKPTFQRNQKNKWHEPRLPETCSTVPDWHQEGHLVAHRSLATKVTPRINKGVYTLGQIRNATRCTWIRTVKTHAQSYC